MYCPSFAPGMCCMHTSRVSSQWSGKAVNDHLTDKEMDVHSDEVISPRLHHQEEPAATFQTPANPARSTLSPAPSTGVPTRSPSSAFLRALAWPARMLQWPASQNVTSATNLLCASVRSDTRTQKSSLTSESLHEPRGCRLRRPHWGLRGRALGSDVGAGQSPRGCRPRGPVAGKQDSDRPGGGGPAPPRPVSWAGGDARLAQLSHSERRPGRGPSDSPPTGQGAAARRAGPAGARRAEPAGPLRSWARAARWTVTVVTLDAEVPSPVLL